MWKAKRLIKNKNSVSDIYKEIQIALESDINDNQRVELLAEYGNLIDKSAARHYLSKAFEKAYFLTDRDPRLLNQWSELWATIKAQMKA